ncbi:hypothetical protein [Flavobacterium sp. 123]|uniref:hypothetical protein n=1 Tax=Flavobacterium sp. 123 TaxID=2135627 RepID=UPI000EADCC2F|nr:hypothetical protein [Flavobacterium sp. 123]RKS99235.1 hypothetical protein C8C88_1009 [Flavobacterium sp. 123]
MKKRLEADLISIAHRILQLKNKSDINQLYLETQKLYEKLAVLRFVDAQFGDIKPTIGQAEIEKQIEEVFETIENSPIASVVIEEIIEIPEATTETTNSEVEAEKEEIIIEEIVEEPVAEEEIVAEEAAPSEDLSFHPSFELTEEEPEEVEVEEIKKPEVVQISFEDLLGGNYDEAQFVKVHPVENIPTAIAIDFEEKELIPIPEINIEEPEEPKAITLNEKLAKGINIDLNDRIAFTKQLFGNSSEDYNRVLNQLITYDSFEETKDFIEDMVKPDYNNWEGKEEYVQRFMEIIEKKFS